jgi:hypothetical protein
VGIILKERKEKSRYETDVFIIFGCCGESGEVGMETNISKDAK